MSFQTILLSAIYFGSSPYNNNNNNNKNKTFLIIFYTVHYRLGLRLWKLPLNISRKRRRKIQRPMWSSPTIWEMGIFLDDYSIGNFTLFFLFGQFIQICITLAASTPYITIMLFKKCKTFLLILVMLNISRPFHSNYEINCSSLSFYGGG